MNAADLVAYDVNWARYCLECCHAFGIDTSRDKPEGGYGGPVFARDLEGEETCSECHESIGSEPQEDE